MARRFIDLSIYLENDVISDPPAFAPKIQYFNHQNSFQQMAPFFPGLKQADLPDGEVWAVEMVQLSTHNGTHLDAPYHFHSTMDKALGEKKKAWTIDEVPPASRSRSARPSSTCSASACSTTGRRAARWRRGWPASPSAGPTCAPSTSAV